MLEIVHELEGATCAIRERAKALGDIVFNLSEYEHRVIATQTAKADLVNEVEAATTELFRLRKQSKVKVPLRYFQGVAPRPSFLSVETILNQSSLAQDILRNLKGAGTEDRLFRQRPHHGAIRYERTYRLLIAGLATVAAPHITTLQELGPEAIETWLYFYSCSNTQHFRRRDLWASGFHVASKCLKEIAKDLGSLFNVSTIRSFGRIQRYNAYHGLPDDKMLWPISPKTILEFPPRHLLIWRRLYDEWRKTERPRGRSPFTGVARMLCWVNAHSPELAGDPTAFLNSEPAVRYPDYIKDVRVKAGQKPVSTTLCNELRDVRYFSIFVREKLGLPPEAKPIVTLGEIANFEALLKRQGTVRNKSSEVSAMPLPLGKYELLRQVLEEGEAGWPGRHSSCQALIKGKNRYVPVLPTLFLIPYDLPERFAQLRRIDSGEGDKYAFNGETLSWSDNTGPHAGYWEKVGSSEAMHGYAQRTSNPKITGFFINSNKTGKPWVIPWQNHAVHRLLWNLRQWVEKWVPIRGPLSSEEVADAEMPDEGYAAAYPEVFPLFRMPAGRVSVGGAIVQRRQVNQFWLDLMLEVQTRWNAARPPEKHEFFVELNKFGQPCKSRYGAHGMRSAGITRMLQGGVSLSTVSRLGAGHATLLMTMKYFKLDPLELHRQFDEASIKAKKLDGGNFIRDLEEWSLEEALGRTVAGSIEALENALNGDRSLWVQTDLGMCPWEGMRCGDGGPVRRAGTSKTGKDKSEYHGVEGGHGNCVLCRHYVTEKRFAEALIAFAATASRRLTNMARRILELQEEASGLEAVIASIDEDDDRFDEVELQLKSLNVAINDLVMKQSPIANTLVRIQEILHQFELLENDGEGGPTWLVHEQNSLEEWVAVSDFEQVSLIVNAGRIYKTAYDSEAELMRQRFVDEIAVQSGYQPIYLTARTNEQRQKSYDLAVRHILERATRTDLMQLDKGGVTFEQLGLGRDTIRATFVPMQFNGKKLLEVGSS